MANVYFKRGTQANLDKMSSYVEGSFYLTTDTDRLYFAQSENDLAKLNQFIVSVDSISSIQNINAEPGDFYYIKDANILAVRNSQNTDWIQINPDTQVSSMGTILTQISGTNGVKVTTQTNQSRTGAGIDTDLQRTTDFDIIGGSNVHLAVVDNKIQISADNDTTNTTYDLTVSESSNDGIVNLVGGDNTTDSIHFTGKGAISVQSSPGENEGDPQTVTITGQDPIDRLVDSVTAGTFKTTLTFQHIAGKDAQTQDKVSNGVTPVVKYGVEKQSNGDKTYTERGTFVDVSEGALSPAVQLDVYSAEQIDDLLESKFSSFNAMEYRGTITASNAAQKLSLSTAQAGDTYKAQERISLSSPNLTAEVGDLIIAEKIDPEGLENAENLQWSVIPSGDEQVLRLNITNSQNLVTLEDSKATITGRAESLGGIKFQEDNNSDIVNATDPTRAIIDIETTTATANSNIAQVTLKHGLHGRGAAVDFSHSEVQTAHNSINIPTITSISVDANGHIAGISGATYTVVDTHAQLRKPALSSNISDGKGIYTATLQLDTDSQSQDIKFSLLSDNLKISKVEGEAGLKVNLEWESFDTP